MQDRLLTIEERFFLRLAEREQELEQRYKTETIDFAELRFRTRNYQAIRTWLGMGFPTDEIVTSCIPHDRAGRSAFSSAWERSEWNLIEQCWHKATTEYNLEVARLIQSEREKTWQ